MSIKNKWPALEYDFRQEAISRRSLEQPVIKDIIKVCDHYDEMLEIYEVCKERDYENYDLVKQAIEDVRNQVAALFEMEKKFRERAKYLEKVNEEFVILKAGDLETDPVRTPNRMHDELIKAEGEHAMLLDAVESYKRQVRMLEASLDPKVDKKQFL
ncbi:Conserved_hypothetical protein [Hexamita inflata]|uniref:Uncharacterized protein n=1 Tax=Hexamita inflata TaxID=28002 RepID=A0AA86V249_9EUKA|nr:Conserved hypothetical protein [Hexamita inflata]